MCKFDHYTAPTRKPVPSRQPVSISHLRYIVETELARHLQARKTFTAYGITLALRQNFPGLEIIHTEVRQIVHIRMAQLSVPYQQQMQVHGDEWALTYVPVSITITHWPIFQLPPHIDWEDELQAATSGKLLQPLVPDSITR